MWEPPSQSQGKLVTSLMSERFHQRGLRRGRASQRHGKVTADARHSEV